MSETARLERIRDELEETIHLINPDRLILADGSLPPEAGALVPGRTRFLLFLGGKRKVAVADNGKYLSQTFECGDLLFLPKQAWHKNFGNHSSYALNVIFAERWTRVYWIPGSKEPEEFMLGARILSLSPATRSTVRALENLKSDQKSAAYALMTALIRLLIEELKSSPLATVGASMLFHDICDYIHENCNLPLNRGSVARSFRVHPNHVSRLFKEHGRSGFLRYLTDARLERAKSFLGNSTLTISEVADQCGFESPSYFTKVFRENIGCTPKEFRNGEAYCTGIRPQQ